MSTPAPDKRWYWLLLVPLLAVLAVPLYNRVEPTFFGMPFFYWYQLLCVMLASPVVAFVYKRSHRAPKR